ncbi:hypothetical protein D3C81_1461800 [compost metagenome]
MPGIQEQRLARAAGHLVGIVARGGPAHRAQHRAQLRADLGHRCQRQVFHVLEVPVEGIGVEVGLARDLAQLECREAALGGGQLQRGVDQAAFAVGNGFHAISSDARFLVDMLR